MDQIPEQAEQKPAEIGDSIRQASEHRSKSARHFKQFSLALVATSFLVLTWWFLKISLFGNESAVFWIWTVSSMILWVVFASFFSLISTSRTTAFIFNSIGLIAYLAIMPRDIYVFAGGFSFFVLAMVFQQRVQDEKKNQLNFSIRRAFGSGQTIVTYALLILIGFLIYSNIQGDFRRNPDEFYRRLGETAVKGVPYLSQDRSQYNLGQTVDEFIRRQAQGEYPEFNQVSAEQQRIWMNEIRENFQEQFGVKADQNTSLRVLLTQVVTERIRESLGRFERFFPLFFTVLIIALLRTFAFVFNWLVFFVGWILYRILLAFKFFRLDKEIVEIEKLGV